MRALRSPVITVDFVASIKDGALRCITVHNKNHHDFLSRTRTYKRYIEFIKSALSHNDETASYGARLEIRVSSLSKAFEILNMELHVDQLNFYQVDTLMWKSYKLIMISLLDKLLLGAVSTGRMTVTRERFVAMLKMTITGITSSMVNVNGHERKWIGRQRDDLVNIWKYVRSYNRLYFDSNIVDLQNFSLISHHMYENINEKTLHHIPTGCHRAFNNRFYLEYMEKMEIFHRADYAQQELHMPLDTIYATFLFELIQQFPKNKELDFQNENPGTLTNDRKNCLKRIRQQYCHTRPSKDDYLDDFFPDLSYDLKGTWKNCLYLQLWFHLASVFRSLGRISMIHNSKSKLKELLADLGFLPFVGKDRIWRINDDMYLVRSIIINRNFALPNAVEDLPVSQLVTNHVTEISGSIKEPASLHPASLDSDINSLFEIFVQNIWETLSSDVVERPTLDQIVLMIRRGEASRTMTLEYFESLRLQFKLLGKNNKSLSWVERYNKYLPEDTRALCGRMAKLEYVRRYNDLVTRYGRDAVITSFMIKFNSMEWLPGTDFSKGSIWTNKKSQVLIYLNR
jgi:hypothetical protein